MSDDAPDPDPVPLDTVTERLDPAGLKGAHGRTGRMLKQAGLPFEEDEFDEADADETSTSSEGSSEESVDPEPEPGS